VVRRLRPIGTMVKGGLFGRGGYMMGKRHSCYVPWFAHIVTVPKGGDAFRFKVYPIGGVASLVRRRP